MGFRRGLFILKRTGAINIFISFIIALCVVSAVLWFIEPQINSFFDGVWYCFVAATTIGFGDICVETVLGRLITIFIGIYGILVVAMVPGVIVSYYLDFIKIRDGEILAKYRDKLERLSDLSKEELDDISEKIKKIK